MSKNELLNKYKNERTKTQKWTRVMGYLRPTDSFNIGKQGEYNERVFFEEGKCECCKKACVA